MPPPQSPQSPQPQFPASLTNAMTSLAADISTAVRSNSLSQLAISDNTKYWLGQAIDEQVKSMLTKEIEEKFQSKIRSPEEPPPFLIPPPFSQPGHDPASGPRGFPLYMTDHTEYIPIRELRKLQDDVNDRADLDSRQWRILYAFVTDACHNCVTIPPGTPPAKV